MQAISGSLVLNCSNYINPSTIMGLKEEFKVQYIALCSEHSEKKCFYQENNATYLVSTKQADSVDSELNKF